MNSRNRTLWLAAAGAMLVAAVLFVIAGRVLAAGAFAGVAVVFVSTALSGDGRDKR